MSLDFDNPPQTTGYLLLFRNTNSYDDIRSAEELQQIMDGVTAWFGRLESEGKLTGAQPLTERTVTISGENGRSVTDGPFAEAKEAIGGYAMLNVDSMEEAVAIARTNPMLKYGLVTEVRELTTCCPTMQRTRQRLAEALA